MSAEKLGADDVLRMIKEENLGDEDLFDLVFVQWVSVPELETREIAEKLIRFLVECGVPAEKMIEDVRELLES
jgi:hypothetical protein